MVEFSPFWKQIRGVFMKKYFLVACLAALPLFAEPNVLVFAGSLRADSYNKKLAKDAAETASKMGADVTVIDLKDFSMPFYDADLEAKEGMPKNAKRLRDLMIASDAIVISTPEYNHSIPAVLKNSLDWASRNEKGGGSKEAFKGKKFAIMSAAAGKSGGASALVHLRQVIEDCGGEVVSVQVSVPRAYETGALDNAVVKKTLNDELHLIVN